MKVEETNRAVLSELKQLFKELQALCPISKENIPSNKILLRSHMFVVEKHLACGKFKKMKARLVADGREQYPKIFSNKSLPTVSIQSLFLYSFSLQG
jgi:hypothetical protein